jgi:hypothetical protein
MIIPDRHCVICGTRFSIRNNETPDLFRKRPTCSRSCGARYRWKTHPPDLSRRAGYHRVSAITIEDPSIPRDMTQARARRDEIARRMAEKREQRKAG